MELIPEHLEPDGDLIETFVVNGLLSWLFIFGGLVVVMENVAAAALTSAVIGTVFGVLVIPAIAVNIVALFIITLSIATAVIGAIL